MPFLRRKAGYTDNVALQVSAQGILADDIKSQNVASQLACSVDGRYCLTLLAPHEVMCWSASATTPIEQQQQQV